MRPVFVDRPHFFHNVRDPQKWAIGLKSEVWSDAEAARFAFKADEHRAAQEKRQTPIEKGKFAGQIIEGGVVRLHEVLCISHLKGHDGLATVRTDYGRRKIQAIGGTIEDLQGGGAHPNGGVVKEISV